jgi:H+-transporting ATPase
MLRSARGNVAPAEGTQLVGTLAVVYGLFMAPTGWPLALMVWGYTLVSFFIEMGVKIGVYRVIGEGQSPHFGRAGLATSSQSGA